MDLVIFEQNKPFVLEALEDGDFDYIEAASEVFETDFFRFIKGNKILDQLSQSYPSPRKKEDVPLWLYVASNLSMRLDGVHSFNSFPLLVRSGGMLNAFGPKAGRKVSHPDNGEITIVCEGFNKKNHYDRQSPCDHDFLRKVAKDTDAEALMRWFCDDALRVFRNQRIFDKEGIFIGDGSYLFVPDNPNYEGSVKLLFDEHDHPVSLAHYKELSDEAKIRCQWRRCYKMVTLLHTNRSVDFFIFVAVRVVAGNKHECGILYELVREFKCFADLTNFTSRAFSMVVNQVVFIMLSYNLLQLYLFRQARKELNKKTPPRIRQQSLPSDNHIIVYWQNYYALFTPLEFAGTIATLGEQARKKIAEKSRRLRRKLNGAMRNPRPP